MSLASDRVRILSAAFVFIMAKIVVSSKALALQMTIADRLPSSMYAKNGTLSLYDDSVRKIASVEVFMDCEEFSCSLSGRRSMVLRDILLSLEEQPLEIEMTATGIRFQPIVRL